VNPNSHSYKNTYHINENFTCSQLSVVKFTHAYVIIQLEHLKCSRNHQKPKNWVQTHASPGGSSCAARRFLEKSRNTKRTREWKGHTLQAFHRIYIRTIKIKTRSGTPLTWYSLLPLAKLS